MKATLHRLQVSSTRTSSYISGSFLKGGLVVTGVVNTKQHPGITGLTEASALVYNLAKTEISGKLRVDYIYTLGSLTTPFAIGQVHPDDTIFCISRGDTPLRKGDKASDMFKTRLENSPYCDKVGWVKDGLQVQLAGVALPYDRAVIHEILLSLFGL